MTELSVQSRQMLYAARHQLMSCSHVLHDVERALQVRNFRAARSLMAQVPRDWSERLDSIQREINRHVGRQPLPVRPPRHDYVKGLRRRP
jgi:hypothetical protein